MRRGSKYTEREVEQELSCEKHEKKTTPVSQVILNVKLPQAETPETHTHSESCECAQCEKVSLCGSVERLLCHMVRRLKVKGLYFLELLSTSLTKE